MTLGRARGRQLGATVVLAAALAVTLIGCGTQTIVKTVTTSARSTTAAQAPTAARASTGGSSQRAKIGDTLTLTGDGGETMAVTVDRVMDPLQVGSYDQADPGQRFVGVQVTLKNVGRVAYSDSPSNGATLLSNTNEQAQGQIVSGGPCGNDFQSSANIAPGDTQQGCIPFEMPTGETPATFQFTLNSGFADQTGQWSLKGAQTSIASTARVAVNTDSAMPVSSSTNGTSAGLPIECSPGLTATRAISCGLASNVFYEYYKAEQGAGDTATISAWSAATQQYYTASCSTGGAKITCAIAGTSDPNAEVDLTQAALGAYSPQQASSYAAVHDIGPNG
jgi:Domain of unknown function (DUF4352)